MAEKLTQQDLPFSGTLSPESRDERHAEAHLPEAGKKELEAIAMLETWLTDPRTGKMTAEGKDALTAVRNVLVEGKNGWWHIAEDRLETLLVRNGSTHGDDISAGVTIEGGDFQHYPRPWIMLVMESQPKCWT